MPYICRVDNFSTKFNPAVFHKLILAKNPDLRKPVRWPWYWGDIYQHQDTVDPVYRDFALPQIEESLAVFANNQDVDAMSKILQYDIGDELASKFYSLLPEFLTTHNIRFTYQRVENGQFHQIHRDHDRTSSLFYLLSEPLAETRWYSLLPEAVEQFERDGVAGITASVAPSYCQLEYSAVLQPHQWYVFNHREYHSVHCLPGYDKIERVVLCLDFVDLTYLELRQLLINNGVEVSEI